MTHKDSWEYRFAEALLRTGDAFAAALACGFGPGDTYQVALTWPNKLDVICAKAALIKEFGEKHFQKEQFCHKLRYIAEHGKEPTERIAALKLLAQIYGFIPKQSATTRAKAEL